MHNGRYSIRSKHGKSSVEMPAVVNMPIHIKIEIPELPVSWNVHCITQDQCLRTVIMSHIFDKLVVRKTLEYIYIYSKILNLEFNYSGMVCHSVLISYPWYVLYIRSLDSSCIQFNFASSIHHFSSTFQSSIPNMYSCIKMHTVTYYRYQILHSN